MLLYAKYYDHGNPRLRSSVKLTQNAAQWIPIQFDTVISDTFPNKMVSKKNMTLMLSYHTGLTKNSFAVSLM